MATLDNAVSNLQRFIAHLVASTGALEKSAEFFKESRSRFADLEEEIQDEGGGLNDELEELGSVLGASLREAEQALGELQQEAREAEGTAGQAQQTLEQAAADLEGDADKALAEVTDANARLTSQGFEALGQTLDASQNELEAETRECGEALTQLEAALGDVEAQADAAWDGAETELDEAIAELDQLESALAAAAAESVQGFEAAAAEFEQHCSDLASEVDVIYDALDAAVAAERQEWDQHTEALVADAVAFVESGARERVEQPAGLVEDEALNALEQEYSALGGVLESALPIAGELGPLAGELARCQDVVTKVEELMNTLTE